MQHLDSENVKSNNSQTSSALSQLQMVKQARVRTNVKNVFRSSKHESTAPNVQHVCDGSRQWEVLELQQ